MKINTWFEAHQDEIEKAGGQNNQLLIMLFRTCLTVPVSEFRHSVVRNKESWEKGDIMDPLILIVEENMKTVIVEEPLNRSKNIDGTTKNTDHTATIRWSDIVKNGGTGLIGDQMSSKKKRKELIVSKISIF